MKEGYTIYNLCYEGCKIIQVHNLKDTNEVVMINLTRNISPTTLVAIFKIKWERSLAKNL